MLVILQFYYNKSIRADGKQNETKDEAGILAMCEREHESRPGRYSTPAISQLHFLLALQDCAFINALRLE
jgi:hypothetical protein